MSDLKALLCMVCALLAYQNELLMVGVFFLVSAVGFIAQGIWQAYQQKLAEEAILRSIAEQLQQKKDDNDN